MNDFTRIFVFSIVAAAIPQVCADDAIAVKNVTVTKLTAALYEPGYDEFVVTRERLRKIAEKGPAEEAAAATKALKGYAANADRWLRKVGNTKDWQLSKSTDLPLGEGRVRGSKGELYAPRTVWIDATDKIAVNDMAYLYSYGPLSAAVVSGQHITDDHLRYLTGYDSLRLLEIDNTGGTGSFLSDVDLPALKFLHLTNSPVRDDSIGAKALHGLSTIDLKGTAVTNALIHRLPADAVDALNVMNTAVDEEGIMLLGRCKRLKLLYLDVEDISASVIKMLSTKESLTRIRIGFRVQNKRRAFEVARQFPERIKVSTVAVAPEDDYRSRWKTATKPRRKDP